jgi:hypothetical protein
MHPQAAILQPEGAVVVSIVCNTVPISRINLPAAPCISKLPSCSLKVRLLCQICYNTVPVSDYNSPAAACILKLLSCSLKVRLL